MWTWQAGTPAGTYDFFTNPNNLTLHVDGASTFNGLANASLISQLPYSQYYAVEMFISGNGIVNASQEVGILLSSDASYTYYVVLVQSQGAITAYVKNGGSRTLIYTVAIPAAIGTTLRVEYRNGYCTFFYSTLGDPLVQIGGSYAVTGLNALDSGYTGIFADAGGSAAAFDAVFGYFYLRSMADITTIAEMLVTVTNRIETLGQMLIAVKSFPPAGTLEVRQHMENNLVSILWTNPTAGNFAYMRIVKKVNSKPINPNDGTIVYEGAGTSCSDTYTTEDTIHYAAFASYN